MKKCLSLSARLRLIALMAVFAHAACTGRTTSPRRVHRVEVASLLDLSKASPVDVKTARMSGELIADLLASGEEGRAWAATLGEDASSIREFLATAPPTTHRRGAKARKAAAAAKRAEIGAAFGREAEAAVAGTPLRASLIAEAATLLSRGFSRGEAERFLVLVSDGRQFSTADGIDMECRIPSAKSFEKYLSKRHLLPEGSLQGVTVVFVGVGVKPVDGRRCEVSIASLDELEADWRAALERAGAEVLFFSAVPAAAELLHEGKEP